ncbi:MAG: hypothetical protein E6I77_11410 [Chloroflexi bacterium]|nr:MAG: hypothetical protein E6I77_11410 [Chloroflexota bacterium]
MANARTIPTGASDRSSHCQRRARITLVMTKISTISGSTHQRWTRMCAATSVSETVRTHSHSRARPKAV